MKSPDIIGLQFGSFVVIGRSDNRRSGTSIMSMWNCKCHCGRDFIASGTRIRTGNKKDCGCSKVGSLVGQVFGELTVVDRIDNGSSLRWLCLCSCGTEKVVLGSKLKEGSVTTCGHVFRRPKVHKLPSGEAAFNLLFDSYERGAKRRNLKFELIREQFRELVTKNCHYCGIPPYKQSLPNRSAKKCYTNGAFTYNGIDRLDNVQGYTVINSVPCCEPCNRSKRTMTVFQFTNWVSRVYKHSCLKGSAVV
jgi:hypothetical protein